MSEIQKFKVEVTVNLNIEFHMKHAQGAVLHYSLLVVVLVSGISFLKKTTEKRNENTVHLIRISLR